MSLSHLAQCASISVGPAMGRAAVGLWLNRALFLHGPFSQPFNDHQSHLRPQKCCAMQLAEIVYESGQSPKDLQF